MQELNKSENDKLQTIRIILKNGIDIYVRCTKFTVKSYDGALTGYSAEGVEGDRPLFISIPEIAAIQTIKEKPVMLIPHKNGIADLDKLHEHFGSIVERIDNFDNRTT